MDLKMMTEITSNERKCAICDGNASKRCSACLAVWYCSAEHQKQHWKIHKKECSYYRIVDDPELGTAFIATRDIKKGTIILEESPAIFSALCDAPSCITCALVLPSDKLHSRCPKCSWSVCSLECAKMEIHADNECQLFASKAFVFPPSGLTLKDFSVFIRLVRACLLKKENPAIYQKIFELCSDKSTPEFDDLAEKQLDLLKPHFRSLDLVLEDTEMKKLYKALTMRCYKCTDYCPGNQQYSKTCVYLKASQISHSCVPNCSWTHSQDLEFKIRVRTATAIKKGDILTLAFCRQDVICDTKRRQKILLASGIRCKCARCLDPTELGTYISGIGCRSCQPTGKDSIGYFFPENPLDLSENAKWKCNSCGSIKLAPETSVLVEDLSLEVSDKILKNISHGNSLLQNCKNLDRKYSGKLLHPNHWGILLAKSAFLNYFSDYHQEGEFASSTYIVKWGMGLLAVQDILSPGVSFERASLQIMVADGLSVQWQYLEKQKRYPECATTLQQYIHLQKEALKFFGGDFPKEAGEPDNADEMSNRIEFFSFRLKSILAKASENM